MPLLPNGHTLHPTLCSMVRLHRLLGYVSAHSSARKIYRASDMILRVLSDASYLSRLNAGSVVGSYHFLGCNLDDSWVSHPHLCPFDKNSRCLLFCCRIRVRKNFRRRPNSHRRMDDSRKCWSSPAPDPAILPQRTTNALQAVGISNSSVTQTMSKAADMRFNWVCDRVRQAETGGRQFIVMHLPGLQNIADFFHQIASRRLP